MPRSAIPDDWERRNIGRKTKRSQEWGGGKSKIKNNMFINFFLNASGIVFTLFFFFFHIKVYNYILYVWRVVYKISCHFDICASVL